MHKGSEKRRYPRKPTNGDVLCEFLKRKFFNRLYGVVMNISKVGIKICVPGEIDIGEVVRMDILLGHELSFESRYARVVWTKPCRYSDGESYAGLEFIKRNF